MFSPRHDIGEQEVVGEGWGGGAGTLTLAGSSLPWWWQFGGSLAAFWWHFGVGGAAVRRGQGAAIHGPVGVRASTP